jgi:hypothetical protein
MKVTLVVSGIGMTTLPANTKADLDMICHLLLKVPYWYKVEDKLGVIVENHYLGVRFEFMPDGVIIANGTRLE